MDYQPLNRLVTIGEEPTIWHHSPPIPASRPQHNQKRFPRDEIEQQHREFSDILHHEDGVSHKRDWSSSTNTTAAISESSSLQSRTKPRWFSTSGSWTFEIVMLVVGFGAIIAIIGVIARYNDRALPEWPYYITLNALIALLATVANAAISVCISSGISQAKWIRFNKSATPLSDMEAFDDASRGTWGALQLLFTLRGGLLGSSGALIAIIALALGPFAQQITTYNIRNIDSSVGANIPRALNFTGALPGNTSSTGFVPILPLKAAVYNGLFAENNRPAASLPFQCQSGNCAWDDYDSLAVCHSCVDITPLMTRYCPVETGAAQNQSLCGWQVPPGAHLNTSSDVFSMTSFVPSAYGDMPHSTIIKLIFMGTELQNQPEKLNPWAKQCTLQACVNTLSSSVINGTLIENITHSTFNQTVVGMSSMSAGTDYGAYISTSANGTFLLGMNALLSMRGWLGSILTNGSATRTVSDFNKTVNDPNRAVVVNLTVGISSGETFFDTDIVTAFYWNHYEYVDGINMLMSDLAISMTTAFRGFTGAVPVLGRSITSESYVHVRWGFAVPPIAVAVCTLAFLTAAIISTRASKTKLWKSNALVPLFHGLDSEARELFAVHEAFNQKRKLADKIRVRLDTDQESHLLLRGEHTNHGAVKDRGDAGSRV